MLTGFSPADVSEGCLDSLDSRASASVLHLDLPTRVEFHASPLQHEALSDTYRLRRTWLTRFPTTVLFVLRPNMYEVVIMSPGRPRSAVDILGWSSGRAVRKDPYQLLLSEGRGEYHMEPIWGIMIESSGPGTV